MKRCTICLLILAVGILLGTLCIAGELEDAQKKYDNAVKYFEKWKNPTRVLRDLKRMKENDMKYVPDGPAKTELMKKIDDFVKKLELGMQQKAWEGKKKNEKRRMIDLENAVKAKKWNDARSTAGYAIRALEGYPLIPEAQEMLAKAREYKKQAEQVLGAAAQEAQFQSVLRRVDGQIDNLKKNAASQTPGDWNMVFGKGHDYAIQRINRELKVIKSNDPRIAERVKIIEDLKQQAIKKKSDWLRAELKKVQDELEKGTFNYRDCNRVVNEAKSHAAYDPGIAEVGKAAQGIIDKREADRKASMARHKKMEQDLESEAEKLWKQFTEELASAQDLVDLQEADIDDIRDMKGRWVLFKEYPSGSDKKLADGEWFHYGGGRTVAFKWNPHAREMWRHVKKQTNLGTDWDGDIGWRMAGRIIGTRKVREPAGLILITKEVPNVEVMAVRSGIYCVVPGYGTNVDKVKHKETEEYIEVEGKYLKGGFEGLGPVGPSFLTVLISRFALSLALLAGGFLLAFNFFSSKIPQVKELEGTIGPFRPIVGLFMLALGVIALFFCYGWFIVGDIIPAAVGILGGFILSAEIIKSTAKSQADKLGGDEKVDKISEVEEKLKGSLPMDYVGMGVMALGFIHLILAGVPLL
jgi:hypothetical protein